MNKDTLNKALENCKEQTKNALQTVYDALNSGQKKKLLKNDTVLALFKLYAVEFGDGEV